MAKNFRKNGLHKPDLLDRFDLDYVSLPEYPQYIRIVAKPHKTIYVNLDADFSADAEYSVRRKDDLILKKIESRVGSEVIA